MDTAMMEMKIGKMYWVVNCDCEEDDLTLGGDVRAGVAAWDGRIPYTVTNGTKFIYLGRNGDDDLVHEILVGEKVLLTSRRNFELGIVEEFTPDNFKKGPVNEHW